MRLWRNLRAHRLAHGVTILQKVGEFQVTDIGSQRATWIGVFEKKCDRIADEHFIPDPDSHRCAFFGVYGLASQILLIEAHVENVKTSEPAHDRRFQAKLEDQNVQAGFVNYRHDLAEQDIDVACTFRNDGIEPKESEQPEPDWDQDEAGEERSDRCDEECHCWVSTTTCCAFPNSPSRTLRT